MGGDQAEPNGATPTVEATPELSWPLVERRKSAPLDLPITERRQTRSGSPIAAVTREPTIDAAPLAPFRLAALIGAIIRGHDLYSWTNWRITVCTSIIAVLTAVQIWRPVPYSNTRRSRMTTVGELAIVMGVVIASSGWSSPFALCLVPVAMLASFVGGAIFSTQLVVAAAVIVTAAHVHDVGAREALPDSALWIGLLVLVTVTSGLSYRTAKESANQQQAALDRVGRLAEANALLFSLQRVAQTLPASLGLDEVLDSMVTRIQSLIDHSMLTIMLPSDTADRFEPVRSLGYQTGPPVDRDELPAALIEALDAPKTVRRDAVTAPDRSIAPGAGSGLYAALRARGAVVGMIAIESLDQRHFGQQQAEILHGLVEPFGIAIDNARLFRRLRTASADEERNRIARDLHDHIGSSLAYLGFEIDRSIAAAGRGEPVEDGLRELRTQVTSMVGEVREALYDLRADVSEHEDLAATLRQFVDRVRGRSGLDIVFSCDQRVRLDIAREREIWHIAREALINVERHAQATQASVDWVSTASHAALTVSDNGVGMLFESGRVDSYGLRGMRERADAIGATMTTDSSPAGTVVRVGLHKPAGNARWD